MQGLIRKFLLAVSVPLLLWVAPVGQAVQKDARCLDALIEAVFEEDDVGEIDGILVFRRLEASFQYLTLNERILMAKQTIARMESQIDGWTFIERAYKGGTLWAGPTGNLRWLREDGAWMRAYLPASYWDRRDQDDPNLPKRSQLDRLEWEQLVAPPQ